MTERPTARPDTDAPPPGYSRRPLEGVELVAHNSVVDALCMVITRFGTLYDWARGVTLPLALRGRAPVYVAQVPGSRDTLLVVRHSWHGGLLAPFTRDLFVRPTRAPRELRQSRALLAHQIGTPEIMAYALYDARFGTVRVDVASRYIADSYDLALVLSALSPTITRAEAYTATESLLVLLALNGFTHPDLNVKNVLLTEVNRQAVASVLEVDVMAQHTDQSPRRTMEINVNRLTRSMFKSRAQFGVRITDDEIAAFRERMMLAVR